MNTIKKFGIIFAAIMGVGVATQAMALVLPPVNHEYTFPVNVVSTNPVLWSSSNDHVAVNNNSSFIPSGYITEAGNIFEDQSITKGAINHIRFWDSSGEACDVTYTWMDIIDASPSNGATCSTYGRQVFIDFQK